MANLTGQSIGRYQILKELGQGGMAIVYKAYDPRLEREVAVKLIRQGVFGSEALERLTRRFEREAKALGRLNHPHIVRVYDYGEHEGTPYLVMDYLPGKTIKEYPKPMPVQEAAGLLIPVGQALANAHQHGILHRDVKPSNILISVDEKPMLADFGIAKLLDTGEDGTITVSGIVGSPGYMSPEQGLDREVDARTDVYSLGVVLYELITGYIPFTGKTNSEVVLKQMTLPLPSPLKYAPDIPKETVQVLIKALAREKSDRYGDMKVFVAELEKLAKLPVVQKKPAPKKPVLPEVVVKPKQTPPVKPAPAEETEDVIPVPPPGALPGSGKKKSSMPGWLPLAVGGVLILGLLAVWIFGGGISPGTVEPTVPSTPRVSAVEPAPVTLKVSAPEVCGMDEFGCAVIPDGETIKIGMGGPMTGDYAMFGIDISQGAQIAIDYQTGIEKWKFELLSEDTQGSPEAGAAVANKFVSDPTIVAIAGHIFSGESEAAMPIYERAGIPMLSASASNTPLTNLGSKVFNRIAFTDATQSAESAAFIYNKLGVRSLAVLHDGGNYGQGLVDYVQIEFEKLGGTVVAYEAVTPGEIDLSAILSAVTDKKPEAIYFGGFMDEAIVIVNQMAQSGLAGVTFFGCDGTFGADFIQKTGDNGEGAYAASMVPQSSVEKDAFDAAFAAKYAEVPGSLSPYTWNSFDTINALMDQAAKVAVVGDDGNLYIPRGAYIQAVRGMSEIKGITGDITCTDTGECNTAGSFIYKVIDGRWIFVE